MIETHDDVKQVDYWYVRSRWKENWQFKHTLLRRNYDKYKDGKLVIHSVEPSISNT